MKGVRQILSRPDAVNVAYQVERCRVLGPGERFVLWVQGCPLRCPGCHTPWFRPFVDVEWIGVDDLAERVLSVTGIAGLTVVGGEPFCQARALAALAGELRQQGLSVMLYSGFTLAELAAGVVPDADLLLANADLLIDGRFRQDLPTTRPWRGSDNQRLIALSPCYRRRVDAWNEPVGHSFELRLRANGEAEVIGIPPNGFGEPHIQESGHV